MKKVYRAFVSLFFLLLVTGCNNPLPVLISLSPVSKVSHLPTYTLTVTGTDFIGDSKIIFRGAEKPTTFVSSTELTCEINPDDIAVGPDTIPVLVRTPGPGGGDSDPVTFKVLKNHSFTSPVKVSTTWIVWSSDIVADDQGNIHVVWGYSNWQVQELGRIYYRRSPDSGNTWDHALLIYPGISYQHSPWYPRIGTNNLGDVYVVGWHGNIWGYTGSIYFIHGRESGTVWDTPQSLFSGADGWYPDLALDKADNLHVFFGHYEGPEDDVYHSRSSDQGVSWSGLFNVSETPAIASGFSGIDRIAVDPTGNVSAVWEETEPPLGCVRFRRSSDGGITWGPIKKIFAEKKTINHFSADQWGNLYLLFSELVSDAGDCDLFITRSVDGGTTWSSPVEVFGTPKENYGKMAIDSAGNINVVCCDWEFTDDMSYFVRSLDYGATWSEPVPLTSMQQQLNIAVDTAGNIFILLAFAHDLYFCRSVF